MRVTAVEIVKTLQKAGFEGYFAGGCVRDILLNIQPKDFDIVTSAKPEQIEKMFEHTVPIGKKFGIILVVQHGHHYEVATFRSDSGYSDGRRPDYVIFSDAGKDALRRDFTINGMFYDPIKDKVFDYVGGQQDLKENVIRFIGNPHQRILEDHLRLLRAVRFKNQFDFQYEPETYQSLKKNTPFIIHKVSNERVRDELNKMILDKTSPSMSFEDMSHLGILQIILPELEEMRGVAQPPQYHQEGDVWTHAMRALDSLNPEANLVVRWATLLHDVGKPETYKMAERIRFDSHAEKSKKIADKILKRLKFPNQLRQNILWCIEHHMMMIPLIEMNDIRKIHWFLNPEFGNLLQVMEADARGTVPTDLNLYQKIKKIYLNLKAKIKKIPKPFLNGNEIMEILNLPPSPKLSEIKTALIKAQLEKQVKTKKQAITWLEVYR